MENYYNDKRVLLALEKSGEELMDILTFIKEINFEIQDNLGFDVLWDSLSGRQYIHIYILLLEWLGYSGPKEAQKQAFLNLLDRNNISYTLLRYQDPLVEEFRASLKKWGLSESDLCGLQDWEHLFLCPRAPVYF